VATRSTINVRCITYTVPSRLIGQTLTIHLRHDRLDGFLGREAVIQLVWIHVPGSNPIRRARSVNYRHVIESLRRKPQAFLSYAFLCITISPVHPGSLASPGRTNFESRFSHHLSFLALCGLANILEA
jgi:hypothetical protein